MDLARRLAAILDRLGDAGCLPGDDEEERLRKATLTLAAVGITALASLWVAIYAALGLWVSAAIPFAYQVAAVSGLLLFFRTRRYRSFRFTQLLLMLALPFALQWSLGGFGAGSAVSLWALVTPLGALVFCGPREAVPWFAGFLVLLVASGAGEATGMTADAAVPAPVRLALFGLNFAGVTSTVFFLLAYFVRQRDRARRQLAGEQERSERLLLNVLPAPIAERLKRSPALIADGHDDVTVLFADLVGFTPLASRLAPDRVVEVLNEVFSAFDALVERHGLEKIKTLGDGYMAAAGVPVPRADHAEAAAELALDLREALPAIASARELGLALRVGLDTGPVVAGVIGSTKFGYDLWGDTVNTASRMESHAPAGGIQVSERVHRRLAGRFAFERRQDVAVKGKDTMTTYLLLGRRAQGQPAQPASAPSGAGAEP